MKSIQYINGKRILFISVQMFNIEVEIVKKLRELDAIVDYFDERPSNSMISKGVIRIRKSLYQQKIKKYYNKILEITLHSEYDILFVNKGELIPRFFLINFRKNNPKCDFVFYTWDSIANNPHPLEILDLFNYKFSFDSEDCKKYGMAFRPLFYLDKYSNIKDKEINNVKYDLLFLGTAHSDRYRISNEVSEWCNVNSLRTFCYYYIQGKYVYLFKKYFDRSFENFDLKKLNYKSLKTEQIIGLYKNSKVILDINHPKQKGLTMRTFEAIGAGKKVITTNSEIVKYPFYNTSNFFIIDRDRIELDYNFFVSKYQDIPKDIYERLSISGWLSDIFIRNNPNYWDLEINN